MVTRTGRQRPPVVLGVLREPERVERLARYVTRTPFEVKLPPGLPVAGVILADQVRSLDWRAHRLERAGPAPRDVVEEVLGKLGTLLGGAD